MPATASWPTAATSALHFADRMFGAGSMNSPSLVRHRSPAKRLERIAGLYAVEKDIRGRSPQER